MPTLGELQRKKLGGDLRDDLVCDTCGVPATIVHLLPWCDQVDVVALTGDCKCRTGEEPLEGEEEHPQFLDCGYWFEIHRWAWDFADDPRDWTMRDQIRTKLNGEAGVQRVDEHIKRPTGSPA